MKVEIKTKALILQGPIPMTLFSNTHLLQTWMKKIHKDLMNWNEALKNDSMQSSPHNIYSI
jgi:hypothetical protein